MQSQQLVIKTSTREKEILPDTFWDNLNNAINALARDKPIFFFIPVFPGNELEKNPQKLEDLLDSIISKDHDYEIFLVPDNLNSIEEWCQKNASLLKKIPREKIIDVFALREKKDWDWENDYEIYASYLNKAKDNALKNAKQEEIAGMVDIINRMHHHDHVAFVLLHNDTLSNSVQYFKNHGQKDENLNVSGSVFFHIKFKLMPVSQLQENKEKPALKSRKELNKIKKSEQPKPVSNTREISDQQEKKPVILNNQGTPMPMVIFPGFPALQQSGSGYMQPVILQPGTDVRMYPVLPQALPQKASMPVLEIQALTAETKPLPESNAYQGSASGLFVPQQEILANSKNLATVIENEKKPGKSPRELLIQSAIERIKNVGGSQECLDAFVKNVTAEVPENYEYVRNDVFVGKIDLDKETSFFSQFIFDLRNLFKQGHSMHFFANEVFSAFCRSIGRELTFYKLNDFFRASLLLFLEQGISPVELADFVYQFTEINMHEKEGNIQLEFDVYYNAALHFFEEKQMSEGGFYGAFVRAFIDKITPSTTEQINRSTEHAQNVSRQKIHQDSKKQNNHNINNANRTTTTITQFHFMNKPENSPTVDEPRKYQQRKYKQQKKQPKDVWREKMSI